MALLTVSAAEEMAGARGFFSFHFSSKLITAGVKSLTQMLLKLLFSDKAFSIQNLD